MRLHTPPSPGRLSKSADWSRALLVLSLATAVASPHAGAQTYFDLSASNYSEDFAAITNTTTWPAPISTNSWSAVAVNATGTIPDGSRTTIESLTFTAGGSGGIQRGTSNLVFLSTGATDNSSAVAADLNLNFSARTTVNLSFIAAEVNNGTGDRKGTLRVYYSTNGTTWTQITGGNLPFIATNNVASSATINVPIPSAVDGQSQTKLRFYYSNGTGGTTGNRPKISVDDVMVTSNSNASDTTPPAAVAKIPAAGATGVLPTADLTITYDENISAGSGSVVIRKSADASVAETITVPSSQITFVGTTATINPGAPLAYSTQYYVEVSAGAFKDGSSNNNPAPAITGSTTWSFTTRAAPPVVINQYYEGASANRYIELKNLTGSPVLLDGYRLAAWSASDPAGNQGWKSGSNTTTRVSVLDGKTIPANGCLLIADSAATAPAYAVANNDLSAVSLGGVSYSGTGSVVLYNSASNDQNSIADAISITAAEGTDTSFYRLNNLPGFDFTVGSSILNHSGTWGTKTVAQVDSASVADEWYLQASQPPKPLALQVTPSTAFSEGAGVGAATGTVTRSGPTVGDLVVTITSSDSSEASTAGTVTILNGNTFATFPINAVNDLYLDGDAQVTLTVSAATFIPASLQLTVTDELTDIVFPVVINEVDSDQAGSDFGEFVELYNPSSSPVSLDGAVLVFYNQGTNASYLTVGLSGKTILANGYFVVGNPAVANVDVTFSASTLQNGEDAVALYLGAAASYPNGTAVATAPGKLVDAVVYGTNDPDATVLIAALTPGKPQVNEGASPASESASISRLPNGGAAFDTRLYVAQAPSPGLTNILPPPRNYANWIIGYFPGVTDPLVVGFNADPDGDGVRNGAEALTGGNPNASGVFGMTDFTKTASGFTFLYPKAKSVPVGVTAAYEWSTDLGNWHASGGSFGGVTVTLAELLWDDSAALVDIYRVTATVTVGTAAKLFVRVLSRN